MTPATRNHLLLCVAAMLAAAATLAVTAYCVDFAHGPTPPHTPAEAQFRLGLWVITLLVVVIAPVIAAWRISKRHRAPWGLHVLGWSVVVVAVVNVSVRAVPGLVAAWIAAAAALSLFASTAWSAWRARAWLTLLFAIAVWLVLAFGFGGLSWAMLHVS